MKLQFMLENEVHIILTLEQRAQVFGWTKILTFYHAVLYFFVYFVRNYACLTCFRKYLCSFFR